MKLLTEKNIDSLFIHLKNKWTKEQVSEFLSSFDEQEKNPIKLSEEDEIWAKEVAENWINKMENKKS